MISKEQFQEVRKKALTIYEKAGVILTDQEKENLEIADFGLNDIYQTGLEIVTYVNTDRCCAKELVLLPEQTCPEHRHAPIPEKNYIGKEETFRCRYGGSLLICFRRRNSRSGCSATGRGLYRISRNQAAAG